MTKVIDTDIKREKAEGHHEGWRYSHPSFGKIKVNNYQGEVNLFGSSVNTSGFVSLKVEECDVIQDLSRNWYTSQKVITEVWMTKVQYAEMISNPNSEGVPCTIRYRIDKGSIVNKNIESETVFARQEMDNAAEAIVTRSKGLLGEVSEILNRKGSVKKADKEAVINLVRKLVQDIGCHFDFRKESVEQSINNTVMEAKAEISHHITSTINRLGMEAVKDADVVKLLLGKASRSQGDKKSSDTEEDKLC